MVTQKQVNILESLLEMMDNVVIEKCFTQDPDFVSWHSGSKSIVKQIFGTESDYYKDFIAIDFEGAEAADAQYPNDYTDYYGKAIARARGQLRAMFWEIKEPDLDINQNNYEHNKLIDDGRIFIVHGHDKEAQLDVARTLDIIGLRPIILHEQPNGGKTIIEKFEANADVGFAIVLLTPDDECRVKGSENEFKKRARQNVILELGYFVGKLGRDRVMALVKGDIEKPSDIQGLVYTEMNNESWKGDLVRELKATGYVIDANKLYE